MKKINQITNPLYKELLKLNLIKNSRLIILNKRTRDKKIKVFKDFKTKIIFLQKYVTNTNYYSLVNYEGSKIKTSKGIINTPEISDNVRRAKQFQKLCKNKDVLDFGCGWGNFLKNLKNCKSFNGVELRKECLNYVSNNIKKINISNNINSFNKKFDVITMFHVLEHIPHQVKILKILKSRLKNKGKIIIEVPHAEDFLILQDELKEFKNFTFWSEHLILHTFNSIKKILSKAGFKNINIKYYQRYNFSNHLGWFLKRKPGGHKFYKSIINEKLNYSYCENLKKLGQTDTLIVIAQ